MSHTGDELSSVLELLYSGLPVPCAAFDAAGRLVWRNRKAEELDRGFPDGFLWELVGGWVKRNGERLPQPGECVILHWNEVGVESVGLSGTVLQIRLADVPDENPAFVVATCVPAGIAAKGDGGKDEDCNGAGRGIEPPPGCPLTVRQWQVALLAAEGYNAVNIAARLGLSEATVYTHLKNAYRRLGVHNRAELARWLIGLRENVGRAG
ncbi:MAG: LuxR family transcriptional regulator [Deltaproteobacteria bacterium]|nr:MAG: LuxR family transcriptional regulator [Deltaproteobacteria bacterium]